MATSIEAPRYALSEEIASSVIHGIGIVLAIAGLGVLTAFASLLGDVWHIVSCSVYGVSLILLYTASTLYHAIQSPGAKAVLRVRPISATVKAMFGHALRAHCPDQESWRLSLNGKR